MQWGGPFREEKEVELDVVGWVLPEESSDPGKGCIFTESFGGTGVGGVKGAVEGGWEGKGVEGMQGVSNLGFCTCGAGGCCIFALVSIMVLLSATDKDALLGSALCSWCALVCGCEEEEGRYAPIGNVMAKFGVDLPSAEEGGAGLGDPPGVLLSPTSLLCCALDSCSK